MQSCPYPLIAPCCPFSKPGIKNIVPAPKSAIRSLYACHGPPSGLCNVAITFHSFFVPWKSKRSLWFWQMTAVVKPIKYGIAWFPLPFVRLFVPWRIATLYLFCFCFFKSERSLSQQAPALPIRFLFPKNRERSVTLPTCFQIYCSIYASLKDTACTGAWGSPFLCTMTIVWWFLTILSSCILPWIVWEKPALSENNFYR